MSKKTSDAPNLLNPEDPSPRAGEHRVFPTGSALFFSAPPLPTGATPMDLNGQYLEINEVYLDLGSSHRTAFSNQMVLGLPFLGMLGLALGLPLFVATISYFYDAKETFGELLWGGVRELALDGLFVGGLILIVTFLAFLKRLRAASRDYPMRFNRQRREVCFVPEAGKPIIVPWEEVVAWAAQSTGAGPYGVHRHVNFGVGVRDPETGTVHSMLFNTYALDDSMAMWEGLWQFMEFGHQQLDGLHAWRGSDSLARQPYDSPETFDQEREQMHEEYRQGERGIFGVAFWYLSRVLSFWKLPYKISAWEYRRARPPAIPEVEEWSKPLPEEQWAKRSEAQTQAVEKLVAAYKRSPETPYTKLCAEALAGIPEYETAS